MSGNSIYFLDLYGTVKAESWPSFSRLVYWYNKQEQTNKIFCETVPVNQSSVSFLIGISMTINRTEDIRSVRQAFIAPHPLLYCSLIVMKKLSSEVISNAMFEALYHKAHVTSYTIGLYT